MSEPQSEARQLDILHTTIYGGRLEALLVEAYCPKRRSSRNRRPSKISSPLNPDLRTKRFNLLVDQHGPRLDRARIGIAQPGFESPIVSSLYYSASEQLSRIEALLYNALDAEPELTAVKNCPKSKSASQCRSRLPKIIRAAQRLTPPTKAERAERRIVNEEFIFNRLQALIHRGLDSNVGRRA